MGSLQAVLRESKFHAVIVGCCGIWTRVGEGVVGEWVLMRSRDPCKVPECALCCMELSVTG